jgi:hypothetical protein
MIVIVLSTCLINDPSVCREQTIPLDSETTPLRCMMTAPPHVAQWNVEHPRWRITRWRCRATTQTDL